jgi:predicted DNA-binding protein (MmcQ/YjbR family)
MVALAGGAAMPEDAPWMIGIERIRALCLALPETSERLSHGHTTFYVRKRVFAYHTVNHHGDGRIAVVCAAPPGMQEALIAGDPEQYFRPPYVGHRGWIGVRVDGDLPWDAVAGAIEDSYCLVAPARLVAQVAVE